MWTPARNSRVVCERICGPLSLTASNIGSWPLSMTASSSSRSPESSAWRSPSVSRASAVSSRPSASRAAKKQVSTWVEVSSGEHTVATHLRETMSKTAITARLARGKWVKS